MALLPELLEDLEKIAVKIKSNLTAELVDEFSNIISRSIPIPNTPDYFKYETFRIALKLAGTTIVNGLKREKNPNIRSYILWTSAIHIVRWFGLENILYIEWDNEYIVFCKKQINDLKDPKAAGYNFEYKIDTSPKISKTTQKTNPKTIQKTNQSNEKKSSKRVAMSKSTDSYHLKNTFDDELLTKDISWADVV